MEVERERFQRSGRAYQGGVRFIRANRLFHLTSIGLFRIRPDAGVADEGVQGPGGFILGGEEGDPGLFEKVQGGADGRAGDHVPDHGLVVLLREGADDLGGVHELPD